MLTAGLATALAVDSSTPGRVPAWFSERFQSPEPFVTYSTMVRRLAAGMWIFGITCIFTLMAWVIATDGSPLIHGVPSAVIPITILGMAAWLVRVLPPTWSSAERRAAWRLGVRAFAVGVFPMTRTYVVVTETGLVFLTGEEKPSATVSWSRIDVAALKVSEFGVGLSLSIDGEWFDVPIVLEAGGPVASAWAYSPYGAKRALLDAVASCFESRVPVYRAGVSQ